jgi:hypothetical protein
MYCALCRRPVEARRHVGIGTIALAVFTAGISLLAVPFYPKRCAICKSTAVSLAPTDGGIGEARTSSTSRLAELENRVRLVEEELEAAGGDLRMLKEERDFYSQLLGDPNSRTGPVSKTGRPL